LGVETPGWAPDEEAAALRTQAARLEQELQAINDRLAAMEQNAAAADDR
jgi:hypothetical protein